MSFAILEYPKKNEKAMITFIRPMYARDYTEDDKSLWTDDKWIVEPKHDGHRILATWDECFSRQGNAKNIDFIQAAIPYGTMFDGEIVTPTGNYGNVTSALGSKDWGKLSYVVFDILYSNGNYVGNMIYRERRKIIEAYFDTLRLTKKVVLCDNIIENKKEYAEKLIASGSEGVVLKNIFEKYHPNGRHACVKYKRKNYIETPEHNFL